MRTNESNPHKYGESGTETDLAVDYESLRFIELRGDGNKKPIKSWGGYDQDFAEAKHVHTHDSVDMHPSDEWGVVDIEDLKRTSLSLLIIDIDLYKLPDDFDESRVKIPDDTLITESQHGGLHVYHAVHAPRGTWTESDFEIHEELPIDIRGSAVSQHVVAPADIPGVSGDYEIVNNEPIKTVFEPEQILPGFEIDGEQAIRLNTRDYYPSDSPPGTDAPGREWLLPSDVTNALSHISPDVEYPQWRDIGFAIAEYYSRVESDDEAFDAALDTFTEWSKAGEKWDDEAEGQAYTIVKNAFEKDPDKLRNGPVTIGTIVHTASQNGWEVPDRDERLALLSVQDVVNDWPTCEVIDRHDDVEGPSDDELQTLARNVVKLSDDDFEAYIEEIAERVPGTSEKQIRQHRKISHQVEQQGTEAYLTREGLVAAKKFGDSPWYTTTLLLNFKLIVEAMLDVEDDRMAQVRVETSEPTEENFELEVEPKTFNDPRRFKDTVLAKRFSTVIEAPMHESDVMDLIRQYIASLDVPTRTGQYEMGLSDDGNEFVTPVGTIAENGWTDDPENVHVEQGQQTNATVRAFSADPDENTDIDLDSVARMIELAAQSREPERMAAILGWFYAAPHRKRITDRTEQFNPLNVTGRSGSGKTATIALLNQLWGMNTEPQSAEASKHAMLTGFASSRGVPVWFDEYRPEKIPDYVVDRFHSFYKKAATGGVEPRGNQSMGTDDWHLRSPVVVSGESEIRDNAERRRTVNVTVTKKPTQDGHPSKTAFKELVGDVMVDDDGVVSFPDANYNLQDHAVVYYSHVAGMSDDEFRESWFGAREKVAELMNEWGDEVELGDTEIQALQTVVFGYWQLVTFAQAVGADLSMLPSTDDLERALELIADVDGDGRQSHEQQFVSLVSRAAAAGHLESGTDYKVVHESKPEEQVRLNVSQVFDKVSKYTRDHNLNEDLLQSAGDYKDRFRQLVSESALVECTSQNTPPIGRCTGISMSEATESVAGFERSVFVDDDGSDKEESGTNSDGGDGNGPTPVNALDAKTGDYTTVTAKVVEWDTTPDDIVDDGGPVRAGSVADSTGRVDIVAFEDPGVELDEGDCYRFEQIKAGEFRGAMQLVLDQGVKVTRIQPGVGLTAGEDPGESQAQLEDDDQEVGASAPVNDVVADGGDVPQADRVATVKGVVDELQQESEYDEGVPIEIVVSEAQDRGVESVEQVVEKLKRRGDLYNSATGAVRAT